MLEFRNSPPAAHPLSFPKRVQFKIMDFKLHTTFELPANEWNALVEAGILNAPFLRHEYLSTWWSTRGGGEWPADTSLCLISARENGKLIGLAPLFFASNREGLPALLLVGSIEISDYLDLIVGPEHHSPFLTGLLDWLDANAPQPWSLLDWYNLPGTSPTLQALKTASAKRGWTYVEEVYQPSPSIPLPGDFETYLSTIGKKQRHEIRRKMRRAEESGRNVRWYIVQDEALLDSEMDSFLHLMAQDPEKAAFLTDVMRSQVKASVHAAFRAGWLQLAFLEVDGEKAAGYLNFDYDNKIWVYNSGLNPRFRDLSPGWVLLGYLLRWANEHQRCELDFMRGSEDYKYKFGAENRHVQRVRVSRPQASGSKVS